MIIEERYPHAVIGRFPDEGNARRGMTALLEGSDLSPQQVALLRPGDQRLSRKLEPESGRIFRTLLNAHLSSAVAGFVAGLALAWLTIQIGPGWAGNSPLFTYLTFAWVSTLAGAMIGGLITLRPDREAVTLAARHSSEQGDWAVIAHCATTQEKADAESQLERSSETTRSSV